MKRVLGSLALVSSLLLSAPAPVTADEIEAEAASMLQEEEDGSNRNLILAVIAVLAVVGGGLALSRRK